MFRALFIWLWLASGGLQTTYRNPSVPNNFALASFLGLANADQLEIFQSGDGIIWSQLPVSYDCNSGAGGCSVRDPDIAKFGSRWWILHTCPETVGEFCITSSLDLANWSNWVFAVANSTTAPIYAPNWVHNPDGTPYQDASGCPHAAVVYQPNGSTFQLAETHPTNCSDFTQAWSQAVILALPTGETVPNQLDPFIVCISPTGGPCTGTGDTFYLWYLELTLSTSEYINYASCSTLTGQYVLKSPGGNWTNWPSPTQEGPAIIQLSDRWRMYFDNVGAPPGNLTAGQVYYSDSFDNWKTWTTAIAITTPSQAKHGTAIYYP